MPIDPAGAARKRVPVAPAGAPRSRDVAGRASPAIALSGSLARLAGFGIALAIAAPVAAATITVSAERRADAIDVEASAVMNADPASAWRVLTDYERYVEFIPGLRVSRVVARSGTKVTVRQSGDAPVWWLPFSLDVTFEVTEIPPTRLQSRAVAGSLRSLESSYLLTPAGSGVRLRYAGRIASVYGLLGPVETFAVRQSVASQFQALADAIEQRSNPGARQSSSERPHGT